MILLDTNVISALMLLRPDQTVAEWLDHKTNNAVWTTSVTVFELRSGLETMPPGQRRSQRIEAFERLLAEIIEHRFADFDLAAAEQAAILFAERQKRGRPGELRDTMIAGIGLATHATLATRNIKHFEDIASSVVNPWQA